MSIITGILMVTLAGIGTGSIAWPMKIMKKLEFEHYWFFGMLIGLIIIPWSVVMIFVPHPFQAYREVGFSTLLVANLFAIGWGIANVLYGICVVRIGAALTGAILSGLGLSVGAILPLILKGSGLFSQAPDLVSPAGLTIMIGVILILIGVYFCSIAGFGRENKIKEAADIEKTISSPQGQPESKRGGFFEGLIMVIIAGITSSGISLCFVYGQGPIVQAMQRQNVGATVTNMSVWAAAILGGAAVNIIYPAYIMTKKKNWSVLWAGGKDLLLASAIGIQFMVAIMLLGKGMLLLGALGASIGFGIQQAMQILGNQAVGFLSGEWKDIKGRPLRQMITAIIFLLVAVLVLAGANILKPQ